MHCAAGHSTRRRCRRLATATAGCGPRHSRLRADAGLARWRLFVALASGRFATAIIATRLLVLLTTRLRRATRFDAARRRASRLRWRWPTAGPAPASLRRSALGIFWRVTRSMSRSSERSSSAQNATAEPSLPARAVRPMRWTYCSGTSGSSYCTTCADRRDVDAARRDVGRDQRPHLAGLELGQRAFALGLALVAVDGRAPARRRLRECGRPCRRRAWCG